jgi:nucleoside-diphosphate-sugar epimerase
VSAVAAGATGVRPLAERRALVTGASGFIGAHLVARLLREGVEVHVLQRGEAPSPRLAPLRAQLSVWRADVTDRDALHAAFEGAAPDLVVHLAADTTVRRTHEGWAGVERSVRVNLEGTLAMVRETIDARHPVSVFVRAGGLEEYGTGATPYVETQREQPISPYSASQVAATHYCEMLQRETATPLITLRPALVYGPGQSTDFLIPSLITSCLRGIDFDMTAGTQYRDLLYIDDLIEAFVRALTREGVRGVINVGHGIEHAVRDVAQEIVRLCGSESRLRIGARPARPGDLAHLVTSTRRSSELLDWQPAVPLAEGLVRTIAWYRAQLAEPGAHALASEGA